MQEVHIFLVVSSHAPRMKTGSYHYCCIVPAAVNLHQKGETGKEHHRTPPGAEMCDRGNGPDDQTGSDHNPHR